MPLEVIGMIMGYLNAEGLKALRLANKKFGAAGRCLLCRNVNVTEVLESFQRLREISRQDEEILRSCKHLTYMPFTLTRLPLKAHYVSVTQHGLHKAEFDSLIAEREDLARGFYSIGYLTSAL